ncbi:MAG: diversity-generating retroelement protein Avd [Planctomycetes bacterium]|nr:diversity-generating retroelement protein Avd [Planctomycetota bacterium]
MMREDTREVSVITKTYDFILWSVPHIAKFPRDRRFVLGERMERTLYDVLDALIEAKYSREKCTHLSNANRMLERFRFQFRMAKDLKILSGKSYEFAARNIDAYRRGELTREDLVSSLAAWEGYVCPADTRGLRRFLYDDLRRYMVSGRTDSSHSECRTLVYRRTKAAVGSSAA